MVPPPPAYLFKDLESKMLGPDYPSPDTSFEKNWAVTHPPRVPPHAAKDLRHLINAGHKINAWKEKCRANETKWRIVKLKADIKKLQGADAESTSAEKTDAEEAPKEDVQSQEHENEDRDQDDEANQEFWLDLSSILLFLISLLLIFITTSYISSAP